MVTEQKGATTQMNLKKGLSEPTHLPRPLGSITMQGAQKKRSQTLQTKATGSNTNTHTLYMYIYISVYMYI